MLGISSSNSSLRARMHPRWFGACMSLIGAVAAVCAVTYYTRSQRSRNVRTGVADEYDASSRQGVSDEGFKTSSGRMDDVGASAFHPNERDQVSIPALEPPLSHEDAERAKLLLHALKDKANRAFQEMRLEDAMHGYQSCLDVISTLGRVDSNIETMRNVLYANVIMTLIKLHEYESASHVATMLLQDSTTTLSSDLMVKVLFRRGLASKGLGHMDAALSDLQAALQYSPDQRNPAAEREIAYITRAR